MKRTLVIAVAALALFGACGGGDDGGGSGSGDVQMVAGQMFEPDTLTVSVGDTVTWSNESSETHTVTAYEDKIPDGADYFSSGGFGSEEEARSNLSDALIDPGETFEVTFDTAGTYSYFCLPHEASGMKGTIIVK